MLHNDISNRQAPVICFDSNILFTNEPVNATLMGKLFRKLAGNNAMFDFLNRKVNLDVVNAINNVWYGQDLSIYFALSDQYGFTEELTELLNENDVCYTRLFSYPSIEFLRHKCQYEYYFYVSNDKEHLSKISMKNAITLDELAKQINVARR